jgi:hypothetical protein
MPNLRLPGLPEGWTYFATWQDGLFATAGLILVVLMVIWWRQQTRHWFRIVTTFLLVALLMNIASYYIFQVPPHHVSCPAGCAGWRGFPRPVATLEFGGMSRVGWIDFALNLLLLWILWMGAGVVWRLLGIALRWSERTRRFRLSFILILGILPWALLPRLLDPPQPTAFNEDLRIANNALRAAEFTYTITGFWVQRLALEDLRQTTVEPEDAFGAQQERPVYQVCLRGYTYFYLPWRRYRIELESNGVTAVDLTELPLDDACWDDE